ncbi:MAG TPA: hypothetical protein VNH18_15750, partial [Bryobacteraceae bacterium]|nr:hypothetical protein [Bryobacteraceae bacterium]
MFAFELSISIVNPSSTAPVHQYPLPIVVTGTAYTTIKAACRSDLADFEIQDANGAALQWGLVSDTGTALDVAVKVPFIAAGGTLTIYAAYGDAAVTVSSSNLNALQIDPPKPVLSVVYSQQDNDDGHGYNGSPTVLRLRHQQGEFAHRNGYLLLAFCEGGGVLGTADQQSDGHAVVLTSADEGASWFKRDILSGAGMACLPLSSLYEDTDGTIYLFYSFGTDTQIFTGTAYQYITKSVDGGATWNTAEARPIP